MSPDDDSQTLRTKYTHDEDRALSDAVLDAIAAFKDEDITKSGFVLYDDVDPDAIDGLFREGARPRTTVSFDTDDVRVELYGDDGVVITVQSKTA
jgi:hypothetical protein